MRKALSPSAKPNSIASITNPGLRSYPYYSTSTANQYKAFRNWVSVCIFKRADGIAKISNRAATSDKGNKPLPPEHWLSQLLLSPNKPAQITWVQIKKSIVQYLDATGNAFVWMPRTFGGFISPVPTQMWVLPTNCVAICTNGMDGKLVSYYKVTLGTNHFIIPASEMLHIKTMKPSNSFEKQFLVGSPLLLDAAIDAADIDDNVRKYIKDRFANELIEPMTINQSGEDELDETAVKQLKEQLKNELVNRNIAAVMPKGVALVPVPTNGVGSSAITSSISNESNVKLIAGVFGVPYGMLDTSSQQNVATSETNERAFQLECIEPLMSDIEAAFNTYLAQFDPTICITHDQYKYIDRVYQLQENKFYLDYGIKTRNELRAECGLPPIDGGNEPLLPMGLTTWEAAKEEATATVPAASQFQQPTNQPEDRQKPEGKPTETGVEAPKDEEAGKVSGDGKKSFPVQTESVKYADLSADEKKIAWKRLDDINKDFRNEIKKAWKSAFAAIGAEVQANLSTIKDKLPDGSDKSADTVENTKAGINSELNINLFDLDKWIATMKKQTGATVSNLAYKIIKETLEQAGGSLPESDFTAMVREAQKFSTSKIAESINTVDSELKDLIRNTVSNNPKFSRDELFKAITDATKDKFSRVYTASRAMNIATTTTTAATGNAQDNTIAKLDYEKIWMSQRDGRVRVSHFNADGGRPDAEGFFNIGSDRMRHPAGGSQAKENCYCRCYLFAQKKEGK